MVSTAFLRGACTPGPVANLIVALATLVGGCSADVTRFDFPAFSIAENGSSKSTGSLPVPSAPLARQSASTEDLQPAAPRNAGLGDAAPPPAYGTGSVLGNTAPRGYDPPPSAAQPPALRERTALRTPQRGAERPRLVAGESIEVQQGDTLTGIARRHGVSIAALIELNGLGDGATLKPGQRLALPASAPAPKVADYPADAHRDYPPGWEARHTLRFGESLYGVARQYRVELSELQRVNGIAEPTKVRTGTVLAVPRLNDPEAGRRPAGTAAVPPSATGPPAQPRIINQPLEQKTAALGNRADDAAPGPASTGPELGKFRWPARGRVIAAFGRRPDGTHNDGVNIAVPLGTEIHAAEGGRVAYAGSELKGYGNLVLIRHESGWVTAYAHADQLLVKRDDVVKRGQIIGRAGKTGNVDQPQLHFELRQGAKPVDPMPHMER